MMSQRLIQSTQTSTVADVLDRILEKGLVIAGDIKIKLLDLELLTIQVRLVVCSVDKAIEMGIDFWRNDPNLSSHARSGPEQMLAAAPASPPAALPAGESTPELLARRVADLEAAVAKLEGASSAR